MADPKVNVIRKNSGDPQKSGVGPEKNAIGPEKKLKTLGIPIWIFILLPIQFALVAGFAAVMKRAKTENQKRWEAEKKNAAEKSKPANGPFILDPFTVNLNEDDAAAKLLTVSMTFEFEKEAYRPEIASKVPEIRDELMMLISSKAPNEVETPELIKQLEGEILSRVNRILTVSQIQKVYFTQFNLMDNPDIGK